MVIARLWDLYDLFDLYLPITTSDYLRTIRREGQIGNRKLAIGNVLWYTGKQRKT